MPVDSSTQQGFPNVSAPLVDDSGQIQQAWLQLLIQLWNRTGGAPGVSSEALAILEAIEASKPNILPEPQLTLPLVLANTGIEGPQGQPGLLGPPGYDGEDGETGPPGPAGQPGTSGSPGPTGATGATGPQGPIGFGIDGMDGNDGMTIPGSPGPIGPQGAVGPQGPPGFQGVDGEEGPEGFAIPGPIGSTGATGATGPAGGALALISEVVTSAAQASVTFSSITNVYRDLVVRVRGRGTASASAVNINVQFNGDTGANYDIQYSQGSNTTVSAGAASASTSFIGFQIPAATATANYAGGGDLIIFDYRGTTFFKVATGITTSVVGGSLGNVTVIEWAGNWRSTSAINSITVIGPFAANSVVSLYGSS